MRPDLVVRGRRIVTPQGARPAAVHVRGGIIERVAAHDDTPPCAELVDAGDAAVLPGLVDSHVHVNEPGRTEWEGFATATRAAAAGGVTTIVDMPLNSVPPTTTVAALEAKRAAAEGRCWVDVGFWGGAVPGNAGDFSGLAAAGVFGFKAFLVDSGVGEFPPVDPDELEKAVAAASGQDRPTIVHAEASGPIAAATAAAAGADPRSHATWLASRPDAAEVEAVAGLAALSRRLGARVHVLHLSSAEALETLRAGRAAGARLTAETCPHYLTLAAEDIPDGATDHKCAPPIRSRANRERLWQGLADGTVGMIVSDHSPCPPALKRPDTGDFMQAWGGIASLQLGLAVVWTAARERGHDLCDLARWMSAAPAALAGLERKGAIAEGRDADLVLWDPDAAFVVDPAALAHRHPVTPYAGRRLRGVVRATYLRGRPVHTDGRWAAEPAGRLLRKGSA